jgi:hypothetical protein
MQNDILAVVALENLCLQLFAVGCVNRTTKLVDAGCKSLHDIHHLINTAKQEFHWHFSRLPNGFGTDKTINDLARLIKD